VSVEDTESLNSGPLDVDLADRVDALRAKAEAQRDDAGAWLELGDALLRLDRFDEALETFKHVTDLQPEDPRAWWGRGVASHELQRHEDALVSFKRVAELEPRNAHAWINVGLALGLLDRHDEAVEAFERTTQIQPEFAAGWFNKGVALAHLDQLEESAAAYERAVELDPALSHAWFNRGLVLGQLGRIPEALLALETSTRLVPDFAPGWFYTGVARRDLGANEQAREAFTRATELDPANQDAWTNLGYVLISLEKNEEALAAFTKLTELDPNDPAGWTNTGLMRAALGKTKKALEAFMKAVDLDPSDPMAWTNKGNALIDLGKKREALRAFTKVTDLAPEDPAAWTNRGYALSELGQNEKALECYTKVTDLDPDDPAGWTNRGYVLTELGEIEKALECYTKAADLTPEDATAWTNMGYVLSLLGRNDAAHDADRRATELDPGDARAWQYLGTDLATLEDYEAAVRAFDRATEIDPTIIEAWLGKSQALSQLDLPDQALLADIKATELDPANRDAWKYRGIDHVALSQHEEAVDAFTEAIQLDDGLVDAWTLRGLAFGELRKFDEAFEQFEKAVEIDSKNATVYEQWGLVLSDSGDDRAAAAKLEHASELDPKNGDFALELAEILHQLGNYQAASGQYGRATDLGVELTTDAFIGWGDALQEQSDLEAAIEKYESASMSDPNNPFPYHLSAYVHWRRGDYASAWNAWYKARDAYGRHETSQADPNDVGWSLCHASLLHEVFLQLSEAEHVYRKALDTWSDDVRLIAGLVNLYVERYESSSKELIPHRGKAHRQAWDWYVNARGKLKGALSEGPDASVELQLGELALAVGELDDAKAPLINAAKAEPDRARALADLGVLFYRLEDYPASIRNLEASLRRDSDDLTVQSFLAQAYLKAGSPERAEAEYQQVLQRAPLNLESRVGLGTVYTVMGDAGDPDAYQSAIDHFEKALSVAGQGGGSRTLRSRELAAVHYSIGYAKVKQAQARGPLPNVGLLRQARKELRECRRLDEEHHKAGRALERLERMIPSRPHSLIEEGGRLLVAFLCVMVLGLVVGSVFFDWPANDLDLGADTSALLFGSLLFLMAGLYLPQVLKLKVAGIELEKSVPDQLTTTAQSLAITQESRMFTKFSIQSPFELASLHRRAVVVKISAGEAAGARQTQPPQPEPSSLASEGIRYQPAPPPGGPQS
jgi:tetratricopeptide (TPR) repeat protein